MPAPTPGFPLPTKHTQQAFDPAAAFTSKWTRADAKQIMAQSSTSVTPGQNSMSPNVTMPEIPQDFPAMNDDVWVWDTWSLTDENANQISYKGWDVIFSLVADRHAGNGFYTATTLYDVAERNAGGGGIAPDAVIAKALGNIHADQNGVSFDGFEHTKLLEPDGVMYQNKAQNPGFAFRDPYTFVDPAHPGKTFMVFEGNTGGQRGNYKCTDQDLGYQPGDAHAESANTVYATTGAWFQTANVGLAVADNKDLT